jgi:ABC-type protease/lipase transport system fused ATPase/permease subunit
MRTLLVGQSDAEKKNGPDKLFGQGGPSMKLTIIMVVLVALSGMGVALAQETQMAQKPFNAVSNFLGRFGRPKDPAIAARQDYEHAVRAYRRCIARKLMGACEPQRYRMDSAFALMRTLNHPPD